MKFNPLTQELFTEDGKLLKRLYCPKALKWTELKFVAEIKADVCPECDFTIYDTALFSERDLEDLLKENPSACLKVDMEHPNLTINY